MATSDLLPRLLELSEDAGAPAAGEGLVVAFSGGLDSVVLLDLLHRLADGRGLRLVAAHLDHGLRADSAEDAAFCARFCAERDLELVAERRPIQSGGLGLEAAARRARYDFLDRVRQQRGLDAVATGHHRDDHVETLLLHLFRGAGAGGLGGIAPRAPGRLRPLRPFTRAEITAHARERALPWREDPTNAAPAHRRNRVRHELLPLLDELFGPGAGGRLEAFAARLGRDEAFLREASARALTALTTDEEGPCLRRPGFLDLPKPLQMRILLGIGRRLEPPGPQRWDEAGLERILHFIATGRAGRKTPLPGGGWLHLRADSLRFEAPAEDGAHGGWELEVEVLPGPPPVLTITDTATIWLDADKTHRPLHLRSCEPGDRMQVPGRPGRPRLTELYRQQGIPADRRPRMPVVEDQEGPVWAVGVAAARRCLPTPRTRRYLRLRLSPTLSKDSEVDDRTQS